jgi:hypothetical protein
MRLPAFLILLASATPSLAAEAELCANRPGLASDPCVVEAGRVQLEFSFVDWSRTRNADGVERERSLLPFELRVGMGGKTEVGASLELLLRSSLRQDGTVERTHGAGDLTLSLKHVLTPDNSKVAVAAQTFVTLPTGSDLFTAGRVGGGVVLPMSLESGSVSLILAPEADLLPNSDEPGRHLRGALAGAVWLTLNDRLSVGMDALFARERDGDERSREAQVGLAAAFLATPNLQFDVEVDAGFARSSPDLALITGVAIRF